mmetsp:Transcript_3949/g.11465  ORF Transcript_3949/g.11465 Transcript_3949/m.11465 type:complete len:427 (-) Transcript_3949:506-1786(-)
MMMMMFVVVVVVVESSVPERLLVAHAHFGVHPVLLLERHQGGVRLGLLASLLVHLLHERGAVQELPLLVAGQGLQTLRPGALPAHVHGTRGDQAGRVPEEAVVHGAKLDQVRGHEVVPLAHARGLVDDVHVAPHGRTVDPVVQNLQDAHLHPFHFLGAEGVGRHPGKVLHRGVDDFLHLARYQHAGDGHQLKDLPRDRLGGQGEEPVEYPDREQQGLLLELELEGQLHHPAAADGPHVAVDVLGRQPGHVVVLQVVGARPRLLVLLAQKSEAPRQLLDARRRHELLLLRGGARRRHDDGRDHPLAVPVLRLASVLRGLNFRDRGQAVLAVGGQGGLVAAEQALDRGLGRRRHAARRAVDRSLVLQLQHGEIAAGRGLRANHDEVLRLGLRPGDSTATVRDADPQRRRSKKTLGGGGGGRNRFLLLL